MKAIVFTLMAMLLLLSITFGAALVKVTMPDLDEVTEALGYSLAQTHMPQGFEFDQYDVLNLGPSTIQPDNQVAMPLGEH